MEGKSDGGKEQNPRASSSTTMEMPALFPRLHVNATERAGPRAPPRNKMALYEQFTIPSQQRLVSPSIVIARFGQPTVHNPYGHQFYNDYQYPYCSHDMPPTFAYRRTGGASYFPSQPSLPLASSASIYTIDFDGGQYLPRNHPGVRAGLARSTMAAPVSGSHQSPRGKKTKLDSHKLHASSTEKEFQENASVPGLSRTEVLDVEIQGCVNVKKKGHQRDIELQGISKSENQHQTFSKGDRFLENIAARKKISSKQSGAKNGGDPREQNTSNQLNAFDEETFDAGTIGDCLAAEALPANAHQKVSKATKSLMKSIESSADEATSFSLPDQVADAQQELPNSEMENSLKSDKYSFKLRQQSNTNEKGYESYNTFENPSNGGDKILEMAHLDTTKYNESGPLVQASAQKIAPKHIVQAIGQQFFWQARISILRLQILLIASEANGATLQSFYVILFQVDCSA